MKFSKLLAITLSVAIVSTASGNWSATYAKAKATNKDTGSNGYSLLWSDDFTGKTLDKTKWNYELHEPGWVNNELQSYTNSSENIYVKNGNLVIQPIKTEDAETGNFAYTSGRVNTKNKVDIKYGKIEVRAKLPKGQGIWPAIWMMPTDDQMYGGWPKCGEIDIMELLGNNPNKIYQTLHYSKTGSDVQSQTTTTLTKSDFSSDYHVFGMEWDPGKISFFVDGKLTKTFTKWFTGTEGLGIISYPAPFDQSFYMILNVAVGGNWPGNPDETTDFSKAKMLVDYVKVYQKASYDENVTMEGSGSVTLRDPDAKGNYVNNGDFSVNEVMNDTTDWFLGTQNGGEATATISDQTMTITTKNEGTVDYAIQAMQAGIPLAKGGHYKISFDAKAEADRTMILRLDGPNLNYLKYIKDQTVNLTKEYKNYTYEFTMADDTDENGRLEFNFGSQNSTNPTATVQIKNVKLIKTGQDKVKDEKTVLADGNYVYNGTFDQGTNRFGYWKVSSNKVKASVSVTNTNYVRKLKVKVPAASKNLSDVIVSQSELALKAGTSYILSFDAKSTKPKTIEATIAGKAFKADLTTKTKHYKFKLTTASNLKANTALLKFLLGKEGTVYLDNVRIDKVQSNSAEMLKNGDFSDGLTNWAPFVDSSASATYKAEDKKMQFDIKNAGSQNWNVQLKQSGLKLEKGKTYELKVTFKSSVDRKVELALMGNASKNYAYYGGEVVPLTANKEFNYIGKFTMNSDSDAESDLVFSLGKIGDGTTSAGNVEISSVSLQIAE